MDARVRPRHGWRYKDRVDVSQRVFDIADETIGNSGGPVFWHHGDGKRTAIGVHWGSGLTKDSRGQEVLTNKAVIIGREANRVEAFVRVLSHMAGHDDASVNAVSMALDEEGECQRYTLGGE